MNGEADDDGSHGRRRHFIKSAAAVGLMGLVPAGVRTSAWAGGSDAPEKKEVKIGFIPLTDCSSVVMASVMKFDEKYGIKITPTREASWASVRDKLMSGELDAAHVLYGLVYGVQLGIGGLKRDMAVLMTLNNNGQGISISRRLAGMGVVDGASLATLMKHAPRDYVFAQTFPTGTHAMWLYYWLAAHGIDPLREVKTVTVPPPQMVRNVSSGNIDAFCVGEPWNHCGIVDGVSVHAASSQDVWPDHPEKVLGATREFVEQNPNTARAVVMAVLEASRWIDASPVNRLRMAQTISAPDYVDVPVEVIVDRIQGRYQDGLGRTWVDPRPMKFFADGAVNYPYLSDGMWFMTQFRRWGLVGVHPDYRAVSEAVNQTRLYSEAAAQLGIPVPQAPLRTSRLIDGTLWSGQEPERYAQSQPIHA